MCVSVCVVYRTISSSMTIRRDTGAREPVAMNMRESDRQVNKRGPDKFIILNGSSEIRWQFVFLQFFFFFCLLPCISFRRACPQNYLCTSIFKPSWLLLFDYCHTFSSASFSCLILLSFPILSR